MSKQLKKSLQSIVYIAIHISFLMVMHEYIALCKLVHFGSEVAKVLLCSSGDPHLKLVIDFVIYLKATIISGYKF